MDPQTMEGRVVALETTVASIRHEINTDVAEIRQDIKDLRESLAGRLPVWATLFITFLGTTCGGLLGGLIATIIASH